MRTRWQRAVALAVLALATVAAGAMDARAQVGSGGGLSPQAAPATFGVNPSYGSPAGGATVEILGTGFTGATDVTFGTTPAASFIVINDSQITAVTPAHDPALVDVSVTTAEGTGTLPQGFAFTTGASVSPAGMPWTAEGLAQEFVFTLEPGTTCASDTDEAATDTDVDCTLADLSTAWTVSSFVVAAQPLASGGTTVTVSVYGNVDDGGYAVDLALKGPQGDAENDPVPFTVSGHLMVVSAELRHMATPVEGNSVTVTGGAGAAGQPGILESARAVVNRVRGSRHLVCAVRANTGTTSVGALPIQLPLTGPGQLTVTEGGGYAGSQPVPAQSPTLTDLTVFTSDGTDGGVWGSTCFSWVSTGAGTQGITLDYEGDDGETYSVSWDTDGDGNGEGDAPADRSLVTEWSVLERSRLPVTPDPADGVNDANPTFPLLVQFNPVTGLYELASGRLIFDVFLGSHTTAGGATFDSWLAGVPWTAALGDGSCGELVLPLSGTTTLDPTGVAGAPRVEFQAGATAETNCGPGDTATVVFTGREPGPLGSGAELEVTETVTITFWQQQPPVKQVLLAWAGQRVILEHDWRTQAGDYANGTPVGGCPFTAPDNVIAYIQGSGPGNFVPGLDADVAGDGSATVAVSGDSQEETIPADPQGACISRVMHESADPGQADIEAFNGAVLEAPKAAFVLYYMKFERVSLSLVTQVSNPYHNSSQTRVFEPGNPWAASADSNGPLDWDVSRDLLVRGRVQGWFLNENPSGREADFSDPLNQLPANRWVLPDDWAVLAGGPGDNPDGSPATGTAEQFRPRHDIMFGPNNAAGIALGEDAGGGRTRVASVTTADGVTNSTTTFAVTSVANLYPGASILVGWALTPRTITGMAEDPPAITLDTPLAATPGDGTPTWLAGNVEFVGPYSTLDIVFGGGVFSTSGSLGLANGGVAGAAPGQELATRDTALGDGDVDMWDAPMPPALVSMGVRGSGFIKEVTKRDVYWTGDYAAGQRVFTNPYYVSNVPGSPFIPAVTAGGGYQWDSWGQDGPAGANGAWSSAGDGESGDGPYPFWTPLPAFLTAGTPGTNSQGVPDGSVTPAQLTELQVIRAVYGDSTIARDLVIYSDNHGEFMVIANGDFKQDLGTCPASDAGGRHCAPGDQAGSSTLTAVADYPDFRGKHFPVASDSETVTWRWGGYLTFEVVPGESEQFQYLVVHALDRDGFCRPPDGPPPFGDITGAVSLHPVLTALDEEHTVGATDPLQTLDVAIDEGIIVGTSGGGTLDGTQQSVTGVEFFSVAANDPDTGVREFPFSPLASPGQEDECQAWVRVSNSLLTPVTFTPVVHDDAGEIGPGGDPEPPAAAERLVFTGQPVGAAGPGVLLTGIPEVTVLDTEDGTASGFNEPVTISLLGGTPGAVLTCTGEGTTRDAVNGVVSFDGCSVDLAGGSYYLHATSGGLTAGNSSFFGVQGPLAPETVPSYGDGPETAGDAAMLAAQVPADSATVHWFDNSTDETGFRVLRVGGTGPNAGSWTNVSGDLPANTTSFTDEGLEPGTYYAYWVVALKGAQQFFAPTYITVITPLAPAKPVPVSAYATSASSIRVTWRDNSDNEERFRVLRYSSGAWEDVSGDLPAGTEEWTDTGLDAGTTYAYWVVASAGDVPAGDAYAPAYIAASTPAADTVDAPAYVSGSSTATTATIEWGAAGGTAAQDGYEVLRLGPGGWEVVSGTLSPATLTFTDTDLEPGSYYAYWVYAKEGGSLTYADSYITVFTEKPAAVQPESAAGAGSGSVHLTWADLATGEDGVRVFRYDAVLGWVLIGGVGPDETEYTDSGLTAGVTYAYWLVAWKGGAETFAGAYIAATAY